MKKNIVSTHPHSITYEGAMSENHFNIHVKLGSELSLKEGDILSLQLNMEQTKKLLDQLNTQMEFRNK